MMVPVTPVVLRRVDPALRGDRVGAARGVVERERLHPVPQLAQGGCGSRASQPGTHHDDLVPPFVRRVDELRVELVAVPSFLDRAAGRLRVECGIADVCGHARSTPQLPTTPVSTAIGNDTLAI